MTSVGKHATKRIALVVCFASLYFVLSLVPITPIIGVSGANIALASIVAPLFGIILGPYLGGSATFLGGVIGLFANPSFRAMSAVSGLVASITAGLLVTGKRTECAFAYFSALFIFAFYPLIGPAWLYPPLLWLQIVGLIILISPIISVALKQINSGSPSKMLPSLFIVAFTSALAGQIAGSLTYEITSWPIFLQNQLAWQATWQLVAIAYPIERTIIALITSIIAVPLLRILRMSNLISVLDEGVHQGKYS